MTNLTARNLLAATHRALKMRAAQNGRSTEAEICDILEAAVLSEGRVLIGSELAALGRSFVGVDLDIDRDKSVAEAADFG